MSNKNDKRYQHIWDTVSAVPSGSVASYGQIAKTAGLIRGARLVGYALKQLPKNSGVPWHRVINGQGKLSFPKTSDQYKAQHDKLTKEGIVFRNGVINLRQYGWQEDLDALLWSIEKE